MSEQTEYLEYVALRREAGFEDGEQSFDAWLLEQNQETQSSSPIPSLPEGPADGVTQTGWQPIETAPERTDVLVCVTHNTPDFQWETIQWVDWHVAGRWEIYGDRIDIPFPPSYWQPLPPPPQDKTL